MGNALFADISMIQTVSDMAACLAFSEGLLVMKITEGVGYKDAKVESFASAALANGASMLGYYHYARADLNTGMTGAHNEALWFANTVGQRLRPQDRLMLDFEQNEDNLWARQFYLTLMAALPRPVKPVLYDGLSRFNQFFADDMTLASQYDAALAMWPPFMQDGPPVTPPGWNLLWWQYTDNTPPRIITPVPGISFPVDVNMWLGTPAQRGKGNGMLIQHPTQEMRLDLVYVDAQGELHHRWTIDGGMAGLLGDSSSTGNESWGNPGKPFAPLSASAVWDAQGDYLNVVAATADGAQWGQVRHIFSGPTQPGTWVQLSPAFAPALALPAANGEPLAEKIVSAVAALG